MRLERRMKPNVEVSTAPIADIVFLLLIFFMLTSNFVVQSTLKVDLPSSSSDKSHKGGHTVTITKEGEFAWDESEGNTKTEIIALIEQSLTAEGIAEKDKVITLRTDKKSVMEDVAIVISEVSKHKGKIVILTKNDGS